MEMIMITFKVLTRDDKGDAEEVYRVFAEAILELKRTSNIQYILLEQAIKNVDVKENDAVYKKKKKYDGE